MRVPVQGNWVPFDRAVTPYTVEPADMTQSRRFKAVVFLGPSQSGKSQMMQSVSAHAVTCAPGPVQVIHMTKTDADAWVEEKLDPTILNSPALRERLGTGRDDSTFSRKRFKGMRLTIGYPVPNQLSSRSQRLVMLTDYDHMPQKLGPKDSPEGSPFGMALQRIRTFMSRGCVLAESSPAFPVDPNADWAPQAGQPALGSTGQADPLAEVMTRKLALMRRKHAATREYMEMNALRGVVKDGAGLTLYDYFAEFGLVQISVDFLLGTAGTNVQAKCREVLRAVEEELKGESMTGVTALVSPEFFDRLVGHPKVEEAYKYYASSGAQPLRQDVRRSFPFAGLLFEEYVGSVTLAGGASERLVPAQEGTAFPLGTMDTFRTYGAPADLLEAVNTIGQPIYARQLLDPKGRWIDLMTEANILPVNKRPRLAVRILTSN
ncbi:major capsid protein [Cereibacter johrii]|uniref:major capsid protein n=1 Tax=Cereibacter johrii TaxID=445629 RepID=UPI003CEB8BB8